MTTATNTPDKYLINCSHGTDDVERATISLILAVTASKTSDTALFLASGASDICVKHGVASLRAEGYEPMQDLLDAFIANGGKLWLCPACAKAKGITQGDLIEGAEIAGAPRTMAFLASGARLLA
ncbi:DsrE family protein [uncultured Piscinibacter sp.]|uniref:DsrE family protein n=1 Tax=uncultured Piscinibacter sp. TaxID=1131835 RepID=UPI0026335C1B|nr:DsrE family protein [uncultured Piscinibacter sp.]